MGDNLKTRTFVVLALTIISLVLIGKPILIDHKSPLPLGLDIRGGVNLRYEFKQEGAGGVSMKETLATAQTIFQNRLDSLAVKELSIRPIGDNQIEVAVPDITAAEADAITKTLESMGRLEFRLEAWDEPGIDAKAERTRLEAEVKTRINAGQEITDSADFSNLTEKMKLEGQEQVSFRWVPLSKKLLTDYVKTGRIKSMAVDKLNWTDPDAWRLIRFDNREGEYFTGREVAEVDGNGRDDKTGLPSVHFRIKEGQPAAQFADFTERNVHKGLTILLDNQIQTIAEIQSRIPGDGTISGGSDGFQPEELKRLVSVIKSGSLPSKPQLVSKFTQGPTLGEAAIRRGIQATVAVFILVGGFMLVYYRLAGTIAVGALLANMLLLVASMAWLGATLTLPGIAGLILTIGMAVDANILITERIREEMEKGKTIVQAIKNGFDRAYTTIFDSNLTTFVTGFFLYRFGTGPIRGFAVSLMIGLATSMLTGVYFSRTFFGWGLARGLKKLTMLRFMATPNYKFLNKAKICYVISAVFIVGGLALFFSEDDSKYGMDFTGGFEVQVAFKEPTTQEEVLNTISSRFPNPDVVSIEGDLAGRAKRFEIKIKQTDLDIAEKSAVVPPAVVPPAVEPPGNDAADDASKSSQADRFAAEVAALFGTKLLDPPIRNLQLGKPDEQGRVPVTCDLLYEADVRKVDVENALKGKIGIETLDGPDIARTFTLKGRFNRDPGDETTARGVLAARVKDPSGARDVALSDPMPSKAYIGARAGRELRDSALQALILSFAAIIVYVRLRFSQYRYGIAGVVALIHDVLVAVCGIAIARACGLEIEIDLTVVAAFLTIVGFSINDTIVIFDRVRENLPRMDVPLDVLIDRSLNQTLSRTILTSTTVFLSVVILFAWNVGQRNALEGFSFAMILGVISGTYSTVYVAAPLVIQISKWSDRRKNLRKGPGAPSALVKT